MGNHNRTVVIFMSQGPKPLYPVRNSNYWFGDTSGCSGGTSGLSRVKLQHEERDMRSPLECVPAAKQAHRSCQRHRQSCSAWSLQARASACHCSHLQALLLTGYFERHRNVIACVLSRGKI